ncbi:ORF33 [Ovine gammaherpesvirus 2]|uniref:ORF33 n=1 Tax=Ovine gammaherpesvirus 2 TaxID=10398 RepID=Q2VSK8_9GAMA|nr:ORF33 [Ovine gammaherpesvirus 2]AAX58068.1 ORF33 [Ovine gammaherpesvirus 2]ABB22250.1 hypothetical protein OvHV-2gp30 [Ovine gammaherpesvirus 2]
MATREFRRLFRQFLNKECLWVRNPACGPHAKVYTSTTARSPLWMNQTPGGTRAKSQSGGPTNLTLILMKPKQSRMFATFYVNGVLADCCAPDVCFVRPVTRYQMYLIYFGELSAMEHSPTIPGNISVHDPEALRQLSILQVVNASTIVKSSSDLPPAPRTIIPLGVCGAWMVNDSLLQYAVHPDMLICCPNIPTFPSLSHVLNLLTKCEDELCPSCCGGGHHAAVMNGVTRSESDSCSTTCPCVRPCSLDHSEVAPVTGHRNILGLLFPPDKLNDVVAIKFYSNNLTLDVQGLFCGVTSSGEEILCNPDPWVLFSLSELLSRMAMYACDNIKKLCLRSY